MSWPIYQLVTSHTTLCHTTLCHTSLCDSKKSIIFAVDIITFAEITYTIFT